MANDSYLKEKGHGRKEKEKENGAICVSGRSRIGPMKTEISENEVSYAFRLINLSNVMGAMIGKERTGQKNALSLAIQGLMEEVGVVFHGWVVMLNT